MDNQAQKEGSRSEEQLPAQANRKPVSSYRDPRLVNKFLELFEEAYGFCAVVISE